MISCGGTCRMQSRGNLDHNNNHGNLETPLPIAAIALSSGILARTARFAVSSVPAVI